MVIDNNTHLVTDKLIKSCVPIDTHVIDNFMRN